jgi:glycosyltransferase involved in cell wall biosynthesis
LPPIFICWEYPGYHCIYTSSSVFVALIKIEQTMIQIYHNILWSKYKGGVFSALHKLASARGLGVRFYQIAETEDDRVGLGQVDLSYHSYPFELLFEGSYQKIGTLRLCRVLFLRVLSSKGEMVLLPGYSRPEHWAMLLAAIITFKHRAVFCDSTIYDRQQTFVKGLFKRLFFSLCHGFFGYGQRSREYLMHYGAPDEDVFFRCQAAALPHTYAVAAVYQGRIQKAADPAAPRYLYVGRLSPEKDISTLLEAFAHVLRAAPLARTVLVGSGPQREALSAQCEALGISGSVDFLGSKDIEGLKDEYARATCLVLPSASEPWGLVVNEALSYGCPVVVSNRCGCVPELVEDGGTGFVFECGDVVDLTAKLLAVPQVFTDPKATATRCLDRISKFSPENAAEQILMGCETLLGCSK